MNTRRTEPHITINSNSWWNNLYVHLYKHSQIFHTTLGHAVNFIVEIQKQWNREQRLYLILAPKVWSLVPNAIKSNKSLDVFKSMIRQWEPDCPCRLLKNYLKHIGFI